MRKSDFDFVLPPELIAQAPLAERGASRLMVLDPVTRTRAHARVRDLPAWLNPGDLLVFNDTRVMPARLRGAKETGGQVELLVERVLHAHIALVQVRASKPARAGHIIHCAGACLLVLGREGEFFRLVASEPWMDLMARAGEVPLPPYIERPATPGDSERYQTVFAREAGAVAAPTAGLHFDAPLLAALRAHGVDIAYVTLHVGAGTFQPLRVEEIAAHRMHAERYRITPEAAEQWARARVAGRRVVAIGTTVVRVLESAYANGALQTGEAETRIFIYPGYRFQAIDALFTNFHLPQSSLLMLVSAFGGREFVLESYNAAVAERYRFFSYGDAMFLPRPA